MTKEIDYEDLSTVLMQMVLFTAWPQKSKIVFATRSAIVRLALAAS